MDHQTGWEAHKSSKQAARREAFLAQLAELTEKIRAASNIDGTMAGLSADISSLFGCDRFTLYAVTAGKTSIETRVKTGMDSFKHFSLPIAHSSVAGHVALTRRPCNIRDVYDQKELQAHSRELRFLDKVDRRVGYRTREMIAAPILGANGELLGVLQILNNRLGGPFPPLIEEGIQTLCKALAVPFEKRGALPFPIHTRFDPLVTLGALSVTELELAKRFARRKQLDLEDVLVDVFKVGLDKLGAAYAKFFRVPYEAFRSDRSKSVLLQNIKREYAIHNEWVVLEDMGPALTVLALDPERLKATRRIESLFPKHAVRFRVTTRREFFQTLDLLYGPAGSGDADPEAVLLARIRRAVGDALAAAPELGAIRIDSVKASQDADGERRLTVELRYKR